MNAIVNVLSSPACHHLALALLHTLWQGLAAAAVLWLLLRRIPAHRPEARYWTAFSVLLGLLFCGLATWSALDFQWPKSPVGNVKEIAHRAAPAIAGATTTLQTKVGATPESQSDGNDAEDRPIWFAVLIACWLLGVAIMAARMAWMVGRSRRLTRGPEIEAALLRKLIDGLRQSLHVTRRLRIVETAEDFGPAVLGIVRPVLVLPLSMMTGLPPDALRAILAHELAHIRRHDYLLNLVQMAIEAVLFFNPAVWWINRQIRIEREACCDAMAANLMGQPLALAEALSLWAERVYSRNALAVAFASEGRHGPRLMLDRIRRIVLPGYRPQLPVSPIGLLGFFAATIIVLGVLAFGTSTAFRLAAKILTPAERMERIVQTQQQYAASEEISPDGKVTLSGKIRTRGGEPMPKKVCTYKITRTGNSSSDSNEGYQSPNFSIATRVGKTWLKFESEGYAPVIVGPFTGKAGKTISGIEVVLDRGFALKIHVIDENGKPVEGATVAGYPMIDNGASGSAVGLPVTDAQGIAIIPHAIEWNYSFSVQKGGFQPIESTTLPVTPKQPLTFTLTHTKPLRGVVLSPAGKPVAGAEIRYCAKMKIAPNCGWIWGQSGSVMAVTDVKGEFVLDELEPEATYAILISAKKFGRQLVGDVTTKTNDLRVTFGPELIVSGTIHGDLGRLPKEKGKHVINYRTTVQLLPHHSDNTSGGKATVEPIDGGGKFTLRGLLPGEVTITAGDHVVRTTVGPTTPHQQVTIDLTKPMAQVPKRQVVIRFTTPDGAVPPEGAIEVTTLRDASDRCGTTHSLPLKNSEVRFEAYVPGPLGYEPKGLLGYWFERVYNARIEPGKEPLEITVPVVPAGAIAGQILNTDGTPVTENISVSVKGEWRLPKSWQSESFGVNSDAKGRFFISPLRLDGTFAVRAQRGHNVQLSSPIKLDAAHPTAKLTLRFPKTTTVEGKVLAPDGRPMPKFEFSLEFSPRKGQDDSSWGGALTTDSEGRFHVTDVGVGVGDYSLVIKPRHDFRLLRVPLPLDGKPVTVQLKRGLTLEGQLVDDATGRPIADIEVYAMPTDFRAGDFAYEAEGLTDANGRFRFSNLDDRTYQIGTRSTLQPAQPREQTWKPGEKSVILRMKVLGSPPKP